MSLPQHINQHMVFATLKEKSSLVKWEKNSQRKKNKKVEYIYNFSLVFAWWGFIVFTTH